MAATDIKVNLEIDEKKLDTAQAKILQLSEHIQKAKSLADDLARDGLNIELQLEVTEI